MKSSNAAKELILYTVIACISIGLAYSLHSNNEFESTITYGDFSSYGVTETAPVVVYSSEKCPACNELKAYFKQKNISAVIHDWEKEPTEFNPLIENNINGVPIIFIKGTMIRGYDQSLLEDTLVKNRLL